MEPTYSELVSAREYCMEQIGNYSLKVQYSTVRNKKYFQDQANAWQIRMNEFDGLIENKLKANLFT